MQHAMTVGTVTWDITSWPPIDEETRPFGQRLLDWAADGNGAGPRLCLVRGAEGSGKSRLLAWFLAGTIDRPGVTVHATVPSEGLTAESFAWELGRQLGYGPLSPARLLDQVALDERPLLLLVPDLHRAGAGAADLPTGAPETLVAEVLEPLLTLPHVRAAVEVGESGLLTADRAEVVDLGDSAGAPRAGETPYPELLAVVPHTSDDRPDWSQAPDAVRRHILDAALRADDEGAAVRDLLTDPGFLVHGSAAALTAALADARIPVPGRLREVEACRTRTDGVSHQQRRAGRPAAHRRRGHGPGADRVPSAPRRAPLVDRGVGPARPRGDRARPGAGRGATGSGRRRHGAAADVRPGQRCVGRGCRRGCRFPVILRTTALRRPS